MFKLIAVVIVALVAIVLGSSLQAHADQQWRICNKDSEQAVVAIAYAIPGSFRVLSEGWWTLRGCGGCAVVLKKSDTSDPKTVFLRAENSKGQAVVEGRTQFCVARHRFTIKGNDNCKGRGFEDAGFDRTEVDLNKDYT